ncbi:MAG: hypothetical protein BM564_05230 [Bacteroidetes bacterium MedPE-SWsnd-G2]|nr:MAG: hypothetical protein BM564_05230 [Bacteroidetes bacterium MedPE-SWsnd-G2]
MVALKSSRINSIDILRGVVMVIMALDHTRDFFHLNGLNYDPTNMDTTTPELFFTRFITHFCAPVFIFLAGTSAFLYGSNKPKSTLAKFLFTRGLWLILVEVIFNNFFWFFDVTYSFIVLQVIWVIGLCMVLLSAIIYLPKTVIIAFGLILVFGHNLLDPIVHQGNSPSSILWYILHQQSFVPYGVNRGLVFAYPLIPWVGVMALGYCFGSLFRKEINVQYRLNFLLKLGIWAIVLFFVIRVLNIYGDPVPWESQKDTTFTIMSFFNVSKYPPSLSYLLITLGPAFLFLYFSEKWQGKVASFFIVFGRVPFFYYLLHILVIHVLAILGLILVGKDWHLLILTIQQLGNPELANVGYSLEVVYLVWIFVIALLYPICNKYMKYKLLNKHKLWLSYL